MSAPREIPVSRPDAALSPPGYSGFGPGGRVPVGGLSHTWLTVHPDGRVTLMLNKLEMGQGTATGHAMIVAEELDVELGMVEVRQADHDPKYNDPVFQMMLTGGSSGITGMIEALRYAAAATRAMLLEAAARKLGTAATELATEPGVVLHAGSGRRIPYAELAAEAATLPVPQGVTLKKPERYRYIGKAVRRLDIPLKASGAAVFGCDVRLPGMLHAALAWTPVYGARPVSWDRDAALAIPGVRAVLETELGPAVLAATTWAAWKGREALKAQWGPGSQPELSSDTLYAELAALLEAPGIVARHAGDPDTAAARAVKKIDLTFRQPFLAHAPIEPSNCTAHLKPDGLEIWAPTQYQTGWVNEAARLTGLPPSGVTLHTTLAGGAFGRKAMLDALRAAVAIVKAQGVGGPPVQVLYDRAEEFRHDFLRPGNMARVEAGLDDKGGICFWRQRNTGASVLAELLPFMLAESGLDFTGVEGSECGDYVVPNLHLEWVRHQTPVPIGFWRSVGHSHNCLVRESVMDELALLAGEDSLEFRLRRLKNPRARGVLELAAERFGWGRPLPEDRAAGIAYELSFGTYVAHAVEVSLDKPAGKVTVHRVVAAVDCGLAVNPLAVVMQVEGATIMGLSALLGEEIAFAGGGIATAGFGTGYSVLRMADSPLAIEVHIVASDEVCGGAGEPGLPAVLPAVANALRRLTGVRHTTLPLTPDRLKAAAQVASARA